MSPPLVVVMARKFVAHMRGEQRMDGGLGDAGRVVVDLGKAKGLNTRGARFMDQGGGWCWREVEAH